MVPKNLYYTKDHEWAQIDGEFATIGITDHAQRSLSEVTFVELPSAGKQVKSHDVLAAVESSKAASDVYSPLAGEITEVNDVLSSQPELVNQDCYESGWICKIKISQPAGVKNLLNADAYEEYLKTI
ncbi:MAG: glycine cleavage system protein GcvH [Phycisphaerae bacterium]|nr:glycine cleavage system protein GcvH [Phycisphaerae bacterium]